MWAQLQVTLKPPHCHGPVALQLVGCCSLPCPHGECPTPGMGTPEPFAQVHCGTCKPALKASTMQVGTSLVLVPHMLSLTCPLCFTRGETARGGMVTLGLAEGAKVHWWSLFEGAEAGQKAILVSAAPHGNKAEAPLSD